MIIKNSNGLVSIPHAIGIVIGLTLHRGSIEECLVLRPELYEYQRVSKLGFPELIMPGLERHDFYLTIESAEYSKGENIEITTYLKTDTGEKIPVRLFKNFFFFGS